MIPLRNKPGREAENMAKKRRRKPLTPVQRDSLKLFLLEIMAGMSEKNRKPPVWAADFLVLADYQDYPGAPSTLRPDMIR
jgi:hypothetical protein